MTALHLGQKNGRIKQRRWGEGSLQSQRKTRTVDGMGGFRVLAEDFRLRHSQESGKMQSERVLLDSVTQRSLESGKSHPGELETGACQFQFVFKGRKDLFWLMAKITIMLGKG